MTVLSGVPFWLDELPSGWGLVEGRYIARIRKEVPGPGKSDSYDRLSLTMRGVLPRSRDAADGLQPETFDSYQLLRPGQLVFKLIDLANFATSRVGLSADTGLVSPAYIVMSPGPQLNSRFAFYYFYDLYVRRIFNAIAGDGVRSALGPADLRELVVPLPPFEEQRAIADYLDRETAQIDAFIAKNEELITLLTERRASSVVELIGKHDTIPLKRLVSPKRPLTYGILQCGEPVESGVPYIGPSDLPGEGASPTLESLRRTTPEIAAAYGRSVLEGGDIVVSIGPAFGRVGLLSTDLKGANLTQDTVRVATMSPKIDANYLVWVLSSRIANDFWDYEILGATFRRLNLGTLGETPIPYPPLDEQRRIAVAIAEAVAKVDSAIGVARRAVELARERRAALISAAVTGKIDVGVAA